MTIAVERLLACLRATCWGLPGGMLTTPAEMRGVTVPRLEIDAVAEPGPLADALHVATAASAVPAESIGLYTRELAGIDGLRLYLGRVDGEPAATALGWCANGTMGLFQVATHPDHRHRGYAKALTTRAVLDGFAAGADLAWLQTEPEAEGLYRSLGFRPAASSRAVLR